MQWQGVPGTGAGALGLVNNGKELGARPVGRPHKNILWGWDKEGLQRPTLLPYHQRGQVLEKRLHGPWNPLPCTSAMMIRLPGGGVMHGRISVPQILCEIFVHNLFSVHKDLHGYTSDCAFALCVVPKDLVHYS